MISAIAALLCAIPIGRGVGGAGLYVIFLSLYEKMPQAEAQGVNYLFFVAAIAVSTVINLKNGLVDGKKTISLSLWGLCGALPGALLAFILPATILRTGFSLLMIAAGTYGLLKKE